MPYDSPLQADRSHPYTYAHEPRQEPRNAFSEDVGNLWNGIFSPSKTSPTRSPQKHNNTWTPPQSQAPQSPRYEDRREYARSPPQEYYAGSRRLSPQQGNVEYLEPRYVEGRRVDYDPRYDEYTPDRRSTPNERREAAPHEVRILGERLLESQSHQQVHSVERVAVPTSRTDYRAVDQERVPTAVRTRQSEPTGQPRSNSPQRVGRHDHTLYSENSTNYNTVTHIEVAKSGYQNTQAAYSPPPVPVRYSPTPQPVRASPPPPPQVVEKTVEVPVERIVTVPGQICCGLDRVPS